jgi:4'-phosphopantetheinyl transferase
MTVLAPESDAHPRSVDVWHISAVSPAVDLSALAQVLDPDETARAARFYFEPDRRQFIVARGVLRCLLCSRLGVRPRDVHLWYGLHGKPRVDGSLAFSVAHSAGFVAIAISSGGDIGIDVEKIDPAIEAMQIAEAFYSRSETESLRRLHGAERVQSFFRCWARKEAYLKAIGDGLSRALGDFDVAVGPTERSALLRVRWDPSEVDRWYLSDLPLHPAYACTLAVEHGPVGLRVRPVTTIAI